jgi:predicted nucleic acid-binding protein
MPDQRVFNASPLIVLGKVNLLSLLEELCEGIVVPAGVAAEIDRGSLDDAARKWMGLQGRSWIKDVGHVHHSISAWDLGSAESEVLSWAYENPGYEVVVDDRAARECAYSMNIPVRGTIGMLLLAKRRKKIDRIAPVLIDLRKSGLRVSQALFDKALRLADEDTIEP